jgi:hypothetical protein
MPRMPLTGERRAEVTRMVEQCRATQPSKRQHEAA